jgi:3-keto-disaccharide hydrolase
MRPPRFAGFVTTLLPLTVSAVLLLPWTAGAQTKHYALESLEGLSLHNVAAEPATVQGKKGLRLTLSEETRRRLDQMTPEEQLRLEQLAWIEGLDFSSGVIEVELAGAPGPGAAGGARGFVGIAFRLQKDKQTYDAFYLRPTNGRADDQERRNHSAQYISHPEWPWFRLRKETPGKYESYVDLVPGEWTKIKIEVRGNRARLYVHGNEQPTLIVNEIKSGAPRKGAVALWLGPGTIAHFRNLTVDPAPDER